MSNKSRLIGQSSHIQEVLRSANLIAVTDVPVLLLGEIGTGKNLLAKSIHQQSKRKHQALVIVNCANLSDEFAEEQLFGSSLKTSQVSCKQSYISQARSGTLFLKNISALSEALQIKLLHFIETGKTQFSGSPLSKQYDVRILVSTNVNLFDEINKGNFRSDLFYRLNVVPIELPALKDRQGDMIQLIEHFFCELVRDHHQSAPHFSKNAIKQMMRYNWPGNIRELKNVCERLYILFSGKEIDFSNLPQEIRLYSPQSENTHSISLPAAGIKLDEVEVDLIQQALQKTSGNKSSAARLLGLTRDTFLYRLKKYAINL